MPDASKSSCLLILLQIIEFHSRQVILHSARSLFHRHLLQAAVLHIAQHIRPLYIRPFSAHHLYVHHDKLAIIQQRPLSLNKIYDVKLIQGSLVGNGFFRNLLAGSEATMTCGPCGFHSAFCHCSDAGFAWSLSCSGEHLVRLVPHGWCLCLWFKDAAALKETYRDGGFPNGPTGLLRHRSATRLSRSATKGVIR